MLGTGGFDGRRLQATAPNASVNNYTVLCSDFEVTVATAQQLLNPTDRDVAYIGEVGYREETTPMRFTIILLGLTLGLAACSFSSSDPPPPRNTTVVVPAPAPPPQ